MNEDNRPFRAEYHVGTARKISSVQAIAMTQRMNEPTHDHFLAGVLGPNPTHPLTSLCWCQRVHFDTVYGMADTDPEENVPRGAVIDPKHAPADPHHFEFDLDRGIRDQAVKKLETSPLFDLRKGVGPSASGIYALYFRGKLVYVGKASRGTTKSKRTLRARLSEHVGKISGRQNITLLDMRCRYLTFASDWWVFAAEFALIAHYQPEWNESGFGSKVPGKGRPGTERVSRWNEQFPKVQ